MSLSTAQNNEVVAFIKNGTYTQVSEFNELIQVQMTRLGSSHNGSVAISGNPHPGDWQADTGSWNDWMSRVLSTDATSVAQIVALEATVAARLAL